MNYCYPRNRILLERVWKTLFWLADKFQYFLRCKNHTFYTQVSKRFVEVWKVAGKALRWNVLFFFDTHGVLFTVRISGASLYKHVGHSALFRYLCFYNIRYLRANALEFFFFCRLRDYTQKLPRYREKTSFPCFIHYRVPV